MTPPGAFRMGGLMLTEGELDFSGGMDFTRRKPCLQGVRDEAESFATFILTIIC